MTLALNERKGEKNKTKVHLPMIFFSLSLEEKKRNLRTKLITLVHCLIIYACCDLRYKGPLDEVGGVVSFIKLYAEKDTCKHTKKVPSTIRLIEFYQVFFFFINELLVWVGNDLREPGQASKAQEPKD